MAVHTCPTPWHVFLIDTCPLEAGLAQCRVTSHGRPRGVRRSQSFVATSSFWFLIEEKMEVRLKSGKVWECVLCEWLHPWSGYIEKVLLILQRDATSISEHSILTFQKFDFQNIFKGLSKVDCALTVKSLFNFAYPLYWEDVSGPIPPKFLQLT